MRCADALRNTSASRPTSRPQSLGMRTWRARAVFIENSPDERVAEAVHELDQRQLAAQRALQGKDQGCDEEPRHAAVQPIGRAPVVALAVVVVEVRRQDRIAEARQELAVVGEDVAVVEDERVGVTERERGARPEPDRAALPVGSGLEAARALPLEQLADGRPAAPHAHRLGQRAEELAHAPEVLGVLRARHRDDHAVQVRDLAQHFHDAAQTRAVDLRVQARQHERHRPLARVVLELRLEARERRRAQPMQGRDHAVLVEVAHRGSASLSPERDPARGHRPAAPTRLRLAASPRCAARGQLACRTKFGCATAVARRALLRPRRPRAGSATGSAASRRRLR